MNTARIVIRMNASRHDVTDKLMGEVHDLSKHTQEKLSTMGRAICEVCDIK